MFATHQSSNARNRCTRLGASLLEITACIAVAAVGVWLGARYLGLDLHAAAYTALSEADVMDQLPPEWQLAPPEGMEPISPEQESLALSVELDELRSEVANLKEAKSDSDAANAPESAAELSPALLERGQQTLAFWSQLGSIRNEVDRLQDSTQGALNEQNVYKVLEIRQRAYQYGAKAVKMAERDNVDPQALQFADQLQAWYQHGADMYGEAVNVWQTQHLPAGSLTSDQLLAQVQQQHDNESRLLFQKSERLGEVLFRRYQLAFPAIGEPTQRHN